MRAERYWLGDSPPEVEHLLMQAEVYAAEAGELLDRIGLAAGASAIDVGCGTLGILPLLRSRVGDSGRVCDPPHPAWELLRGEVIDVYARSGKDFNIGRRAARLLRTAGLSDVQVRATAWSRPPASTTRRSC